MGMIILLTAIAAQIGILVFSITTQSYHKKARGIVHIALLVCFIMLALFDVVEWGARYYALSALLLLLAAFGGAALIFGTKEKVFRLRRVILTALGMSALFFLCTLPAILFPQHTGLEPTGNYNAATALYTYTDPNRVETYTNTGETRKLNVEFWYPADYTEGALHACPLVVFSHGGTGIKTSNESLFGDLASHGYVVCSIDHTYQCLYTVGGDGKTTWIDSGYMRELSAEDAQTDPQQSDEYYQEWMGIRTGDINFVIDYILKESLDVNADTVYRLVDSSSIGLMGHSLGGAAVLGLGRSRNDVSAVIALESPFMCDIERVEEGRFIWNDDPYPVPSLNIYSDSSWNHLGDWPQYAKNYQLLTNPGPDDFAVHMEGIGHLALTDLSMTSPFITRMMDGIKPELPAQDTIKKINAVCLKFFDSYLKNEGRFRGD